MTPIMSMLSEKYNIQKSHAKMGNLQGAENALLVMQLKNREKRHPV